MSTHDQDEFEPEVLAETENFTIWRSEEEEGFVYHVELGGVTLHVSSEDWEEVITLFKSLT